jgi:hypothetical protein
MGERAAERSAIKENDKSVPRLFVCPPLKKKAEEKRATRLYRRESGGTRLFAR